MAAETATRPSEADMKIVEECAALRGLRDTARHPADCRADPEVQAVARGMATNPRVTRTLIVQSDLLA